MLSVICDKVLGLCVAGVAHENWGLEVLCFPSQVNSGKT